MSIDFINFTSAKHELMKSAHEWKLKVNFESAVELLYNSEIVELLNRDKNRVELTINFLLCKHRISIYNSTAVKKLTINFHEWALIF